MSTKVLIVPEDFRKDQYILKPIVEAMLAAIGKPNAKVRVCQEPLLGGVSEAMKWERIKEILDFYRGKAHVVVLIVDRDGHAGRCAALDGLERHAAAFLPAGVVFLSENAWQEVEVWLLAGHDLPTDWSWREIRQEPNPKEVYFERLARDRGVTDGPGEGRKVLAEEAAANYARVRSRCPEDVVELERRLFERI